MFATKTLTIGTIALLAGLSYAQAQTKPTADPHHPETQMQGTRPGMPMTPPAGAAGGMEMGKMMGGGMEHAMRAMMAHGPGGGMEMMPGQHIEGRIAFLKAELGITEAQMPQWNALADARRTAEKSMQAAMTANMGAAMPATAPARADAMVAMMTAKLDAMKRVVPAGKALYAVLTDAQKKVADDLAMSRMGGM